MRRSKFSDVLIFESGRSTVGRQIASRLHRHGIESCFIDNVRKLNEKDFISCVRSKAEECGAGVIIPVFNPEVLARHRAEFPGVVIACESEEKILLLDNKVSACGLASSLGVPVPREYSDTDSVDRYPVVFKRADGHGGDSVYFPKTRESLENLVRTSRPGSYLITEEIAGWDVSVDAFRWNGYFAAGAYKVLLPRAKGISVLRESIDAPDIVGYSRKMLDALDYNGVCGFDYRLDPDGRWWFLECNPRFSGGLRSQTASGFDVPWLLWQAVNGHCPGKVDFRSGVRTQYLKGSLDYLKRRHRQGKLCLNDVLECVCSGAFRFD